MIRLSLISLALILLQPHCAHAQTLQENIKLDLAKVMIPASGTDTITISTSGAVSGDAIVIGNIPTPAEYLIKDDSEPTTISIDIVEGSTVSGITLQNFTATYDGKTITLPAAGQPAPGAQGKILKVGVSAVLSSSLTEGTQLPGLDVVIIKE